jgi:hypothetical protein
MGVQSGLIMHHLHLFLDLVLVLVVELQVVLEVIGTVRIGTLILMGSDDGPVFIYLLFYK